MKVIGIASQLAMGKDVLADYLVQKLNENGSWNRAAFARTVKDIFCSSFGVTHEFIEEWKRNPEPPPGFLQNVRKSLQFIGDGFRKIKDGIWIDIALRDESKNLIFSDSRYINEARAVRKKGGIMIVVYRPGFFNDDPNPSESQIRPVIEWCLETKQKDGPINFDVDLEAYQKTGLTEEIVSNYDLFIANDGSVEDFHVKVDKFLVPWIRAKFGE